MGKELLKIFQLRVLFVMYEVITFNAIWNQNKVIKYKNWQSIWAIN